MMKSKDIVKHESLFKKFRNEFSTLTKPSFRELLGLTFKIILAAVIAAGGISLVDYCFTQLLNIII